MEESVKSDRTIVFNTPLEVALRLLFIFNKTSKTLDLQRLIHYNYLLVHSSDIPDSPKSMHADLPQRSSEMSVNRPVVKKALTLLLLKDLIAVEYSNNGIHYIKNKNTELFTQYFESDYSKKLDHRANWLCSNFDKLTDEELTQLINSNMGKWGSEFSAIYDETDDSDV